MNADYAVVLPRNGQRVLLTSILSIAYLLLSYVLVGFKTDQLVLIAIFNFCYYLSWGTRRWILGFSIFIVYWIVFDYMKAIPNYKVAPVHIQDIYDLEKSIFGIVENGARLTPNEYWLHHTQHWLDVMTGLFYLCWIPVPLAFAMYAYFKERKTFIHFALTFCLVNIVGFVVYYSLPAAPPWYVQEHGFTFIANTPGNTAGLARFDAYFGVQIFKNIYEKGSNVFAAMPSLHSAYPLIVVFYAWRITNNFFKGVFISVAVGIWFSAVYNSHHYVLDVIAGIICAVVGITLYQKVLLKNSAYNNWIERYYNVIKNPAL
jgi:inositol phosphorylceramide synthase catalytic subunit